ncbi:MAG: hypothetical protein Q9220_003119 [cf. Caloplaca sp. 1 TL-2023]
MPTSYLTLLPTQIHHRRRRFPQCHCDHLLGKKSWNVYNQDNIEKVKRDEAAAAAREATEEQRMQEVDAERRIQLLRGQKVDTSVIEAPFSEQEERPEGSSRERERKRRRIAGEDDTDRDIRFAREDGAVAVPKADLQLKPTRSSNAPLMDQRGHINLFPVNGSRHHAPKNTEVEAEKARKKKELEDQYTMRFANAAGFKQSIGDKPWYQTKATDAGEEPDVPMKNVWGNDDPRRKEREKARITADDPMAAMRKGVSLLREVEREREQWRAEREQETRDSAEVQRRKRHKSRKDREEKELEGFSLDTPSVEASSSKNHESRRRHRHRHQHRSSSHERHEQRRGSYHHSTEGPGKSYPSAITIETG